MLCNISFGALYLDRDHERACMDKIGYLLSGGPLFD